MDLVTYSLLGSDQPSPVVPSQYSPGRTVTTSPSFKDEIFIAPESVFLAVATDEPSPESSGLFASTNHSSAIAENAAADSAKARKCIVFMGVPSCRIP